MAVRQLPKKPTRRCTSGGDAATMAKGGSWWQRRERDERDTRERETRNGGAAQRGLVHVRGCSGRRWPVGVVAVGAAEREWGSCREGCGE